MTQTIFQQSQAACRGGLLTASCLLLPPAQVVVQLTDDLLSQAVMMVEDSRPTLAINLAGARQYWLEGMLRHEIGQRGLGSGGDREQGGGRASPDGHQHHGLGAGRSRQDEHDGVKLLVTKLSLADDACSCPPPTQAPTTSAG